MTYFLDTSTVVFCLRGKSIVAMRRLHAVPAGDVRIPLQVRAELLVGVAKSATPFHTKAQVEAFIAPFALALPDARIAEHYVSIRVHLETQGTRISEADLWISAAARAAGGTVVTNNVGEFSRVPNLLVVDWTIP